jgi:hypothetical protein
MAYGKTSKAILGLDDVTRYVFHNYLYLLTENEKLAWKTCLATAKGEASGSEDYARFLADKFGSRQCEILALLSNGPESIFVATRDRLLKEHNDKIVLNYCPRCGALTRTPKAKICPKCSFNWRSKAIESTLKS